MDDANAGELSSRTRLKGDDETATVAITRAVAEVEGIPPLQLTPPLADVIDPDLLDQLVDSAFEGSTALESQVVFPYRGHTVTVRADGKVTVDPRGMA